MKKRFTFYLEEELMDVMREISWHERTTLNGIATAMIIEFTRVYQEKNGVCRKHKKSLKPGVKVRPKG